MLQIHDKLLASLKDSSDNEHTINIDGINAKLRFVMRDYSWPWRLITTLELIKLNNRNTDKRFMQCKLTWTIPWYTSNAPRYHFDLPEGGEWMFGLDEEVYKFCHSSLKQIAANIL